MDPASIATVADFDRLNWIAPLYTATDEGESSLGPRWSCAHTLT